MFSICITKGTFTRARALSGISCATTAYSPTWNWTPSRRIFFISPANKQWYQLAWGRRVKFQGKVRTPKQRQTKERFHKVSLINDRSTCQIFSHMVLKWKSCWALQLLVYSWGSRHLQKEYWRLRNVTSLTFNISHGYKTQRFYGILDIRHLGTPWKP